jgi:hypothetical protein
MEWKAKTSTTYRKDSDRFVTANSVIPGKEEDFEKVSEGWRCSEAIFGRVFVNFVDKFQKY